MRFVATGATMTVRPLGDDADWRSDAELIFAARPGPERRLPRFLGLREQILAPAAFTPVGGDAAWLR